MNCLNCGSHEVVSNKFKNFSLQQVEYAAAQQLRQQRFAMALGAFVIWGGIEAANEFRKDWKCTNCGHKF